MPKSPTQNAKPIKKYSKSSAFYLTTKRDFFSSNQQLLAKAIAQNRFYSEQRLRVSCKLCGAKLADEIDLLSHKIEYKLCDSCGHLNGTHEDTQEFVKRMYVSDSGADYSKNYIDDNYHKRAGDIYIPKAEFLLEHLEAQTNRLLDVGCGSGYFVYACQSKGLESTGIDVGKAMIDFGNYQIANHLNIRPLVHTSETAMFDHVSKTQATIVSAIGVIEHLREPNKLFDAFNSSSARYLYYSVPMLSTSVVLENIFNDIFPRQLSGGHTHLFTESSISKMNAICKIEPIAEWRFGTDIMDLYRSLLLSLKAKGASAKLMAVFENGFGPTIDNLQAVLDRNDFCSEIHCVTKKLADAPSDLLLVR
jgi:SAM-dependent methyltransferase